MTSPMYGDDFDADDGVAHAGWDAMDDGCGEADTV